MKRRLYLDEEIDILKSNIFIRDVKYKREIVYDPIFKLWTLFMRLECPELTAREIFEKAGINTNILHRNLPKKRINDWMYAYKRFGVKYFIPEDTAYTITDKFKQELISLVLGKLEANERNTL